MASLVTQLVKNPPAMQETWFDSWVRKVHWRRDRLPTLVFLGFHGDSAGKESICNAGDLASIPGLGRIPGEGNGYPLRYSCLENSMDRGAWWAIQFMGSQRVGHDWATFTFNSLSNPYTPHLKFDFCLPSPQFSRHIYLQWQEFLSICVNQLMQLGVGLRRNVMQRGYISQKFQLHWNGLYMWNSEHLLTLIL